LGNPTDRTPAGSATSVTIAGFGDMDTWHTVEGESSDSSAPTDSDLEWITEVTVHIVDADGVDWFYPIDGPWESFDDLYSQVDDLYEEYGGEAG
jgi:hypothetical protein